MTTSAKKERIGFEKYVLPVTIGLNVNNGDRLYTYVIKGERGSGVVCLNGPAARRVSVGDVVIVVAYAHMTIEEARAFKPTIVFPDEKTNKLKR